MSIYEEGRAAFRAQVSVEHARHWPTARREHWQRGWSDARAEAVHRDAQSHPAACCPAAGTTDARPGYAGDREQDRTLPGDVSPNWRSGQR